jgi:hypothetical protein
MEGTDLQGMKYFNEVILFVPREVGGGEERRKYIWNSNWGRKKSFWTQPFVVSKKNQLCPKAFIKR